MYRSLEYVPDRNCTDLATMPEFPGGSSPRRFSIVSPWTETPPRSSRSRASWLFRMSARPPVLSRSSDGSRPCRFEGELRFCRFSEVSGVKMPSRCRSSLSIRFSGRMAVWTFRSPVRNWRGGDVPGILPCSGGDMKPAAAVCSFRLAAPRAESGVPDVIGIVGGRGNREPNAKCMGPS